MLLTVTIPLLAGVLCLLLPPLVKGAADSLRSILAVLSSAAVLVFAWQLFSQVGAGPITAEPLP